MVTTWSKLLPPTGHRPPLLPALTAHAWSLVPMEVRATLASQPAEHLPHQHELTIFDTLMFKNKQF